MPTVSLLLSAELAWVTRVTLVGAQWRAGEPQAHYDPPYLISGQTLWGLTVPGQSFYCRLHIRCLQHELDAEIGAIDIGRPRTLYHQSGPSAPGVHVRDVFALHGGNVYYGLIIRRDRDALAEVFRRRRWALAGNAIGRLFGL